ncbi:MAG: hypothetical protein IPM56_06015 [Ignavibacteriales bacterium]|nr:MAG: hypothetical protein IPM56_06015 [Ignavibacteriales bacterium]
MVKIVSVLLLLFISASVLTGQTAKVTAKVDTTDYLVGDLINLSIKVETAKNFLVNPPAIKDTLEGLEVLSQSQSEIEESANNKVIIYNYTLAGYDSLQVDIKPIEIILQDKNDTTKIYAYSNALSLNVNRVEVDKSKEIKDIKEPIRIPLDWKILLLWAAGIILLLAIGFYLFKKFRKKKLNEVEVTPVVVLPPDVVALSELDNLGQKKLWQSGFIKEYHSEITGIIRKYFEGRFKFPALELSTTEVMNALDHIRAGKKIVEVTSDFLSNADLVKFAKYKPMNEINEEMMKQAYQIVEVTKIVTQPEEEHSNV